MSSEWDKAQKEYEKLRKENRLDEIEPVPDEVREGAGKVAKKLLKEPYKPLKNFSTK